MIITKLRTGNNNLPIITGNYNLIEREEHYCTTFNEKLIGDEYHVLMQCQTHDIIQMKNMKNK